tara:strand:- start:429 stop:797 length:369 start_codon:yes stop_codon:yes gene_type:complete
MGHDEDIKALQDELKDINESARLPNKIKDYQPVMWILGALAIGLLAWSDLSHMADENKSDIVEARDYTHTKFSELKAILDNYKVEQKFTRDQVLLLKEQSKYTREDVSENKELLKEILQKIK